MKEWISKKKWLVIAIIIALIAGVAVFLGVSGVLSGGQSGTDVTVSLNATSIQLDIYETFELKAEVQGSDEQPVWTTQDSAVATVENGIVTAVGEGTTNIIATVGDAFCACQVSIVNSYTAPVIVVSTPNICLGLNEQYDLAVKLLWKGEAVTDHTGFEWSLADGAQPDLVSIEQNGNVATVKALAYGKTAYMVSTTYRGQLVAQKVDIKVTNLDITFEITNMEKSVLAYKTALGLIETEEDITTITPEVIVYNKGMKVEDAVIVWESENPELATVEENGKITAVSAGTVRVTGMYDNAELPIDVEVYRTKIQRENVYVEKVADYTLSASSFSGGGEITDVVYDGQSVLKEIKDGMLILNPDLLPEIGKEVELSILSEKAEYTTKGMMVTCVINSEYELNQFPYYQGTYPTGYYVLGNDVTCSGTYASNATEAFNGTFDGRGHAIYNFTTSDENRYGRGLFGTYFGVPGKSDAVLKDIAFINAKHSKDGAFLAQQGGGLLENVYINIALSDLVTNGGQNKTTVLFSYMYNTVAMEKVFIEHIEPLIDVGAAGYAITHLGYYGKINGLYIIGAQKVCEKVVDNKSGADVIGIYPNYREFLASGRNLSGWSNEFWATYNKVPYPRGRNIHADYMPEVTAPTEALTGTTVTIEGVGFFDEIVVPEKLKDQGVKVEDNVLTIPEDLKDGTVMNIVVRSVFNHDHAVKLDILVRYAEQLKIKGVTYAEKLAGEQFAVDLSSKKSALKGAALQYVTIGGKKFDSAAYDKGILTLDTASLGELVGEHTLIVLFEKDGELIVVKVNAFVCHMVISDVADLRAFPAAAKEHPDGYYVLGADIHYIGTYENTNTEPFTGTFDGNGHTIFDLCTKMAYNDWDGGLFGKFFGREDGTALATLKNISFMNATVKGQGSFLACKGQGTLENVYMQVNIDGLVSNYTSNGWINNTSVLFNNIPREHIYVNNVIIEYVPALQNNNGWGYAFGDLNTLTTINGLYIIGADKAYNKLVNASTAVAMGCYTDKSSFTADVSNWDGNGFWTVVDGFPVPNKLVGYEPPPELDKVDLKKSLYMEVNDGQSKFTLNLKSAKNKISGLKLLSATVDGVSFATKSYDASAWTVTLDKATLSDLTGEKTVLLNFGDEIQVRAKIVLCTQIIDTVEELKNFPTVAKEKPDGYYALGADIHYIGTYENTNTEPFTGTFDGNGHTIFDLCTKTAYNDWDGGLFGKFFGREDGTELATLKNISFMNATVKGQGSYLACKVQGTLENVYMQVNIDGLVSNYTTNGWINNTSVLFNNVPREHIYVNNVVIEYVPALKNNNGWGYAFGDLNTLTTVNGLYIIGADQAYSNLINASTAGAMDCFESRTAFDADVSSWDGNGFWTVVDGFPVPNNLVDYVPPKELDKVDLKKSLYMETGDGQSKFTLNLKSVKNKISRLNLVSATVDGIPFATKSYNASTWMLTLDRATINGMTGEKTVLLNFGDEIQVRAKIVLCTQIIDTVEELKNFPTVAKEKPDGYYALGADIHYIGTYENTNTEPFTGTFDGNGYTIFDLCTKSAYNDWDGGLFGKFFGREDGTALATLKNISFMNATVKGQGSYLACKGQGTLENVYMQVNIDGLVSSYTNNGWINNTSVLFNTTPREHIYVNNVVIEYVPALKNNNGWGYAFGDLNTLTTVNGLYIIGADQAYNNLMNPATTGVLDCFESRAAFDADVSSWDGNGFWTVVDGFPVPNNLVDYEPPKELDKVNLKNSLYMETGDGQSKFTLNLKSVKNKISGLKLVSATVDGVSFTTKSYNASAWTVTLDRAAVNGMTGEKTVVLNFGDAVQVNAKIVLCTQIIDTVAELKNFPTAAKEKPDGYYALGADIHFVGTYENTNTEPFTGTFDGNGHTIFDLCTKVSGADWDGGLFGKFFGREDGTAPATLKNISFMNATVKGQGSFLACKGQGTLENVYMHLSIDGLVSNYTSNGWINNTSILFNTVPSHNIYINKVLLEYAEPLTDNNGWGYAFGELNTLANVDGLYIVGADKAYNSLSNPSEALAMGCYADKTAFNADVSAWDGNGFWTVVDGYPVPNALLDYEPPREPETVELPNSLYMEVHNGQSRFTVDLSAVKNKLSGLELISATVDGVSFTTKDYDAANGMVTLDKATVEALLGEKTVALTFSENLQVNAKIVLCTQIIDTVEELKNFPTAAKEKPDGYYALGADIYFVGTYENTNTEPFTGTFDGNGYTIFDLCTKVNNADWDGGLFGKFFGKEDGTAPATLKNISFMNAVVKGQGSFLACKGQGTLDNVYMNFSIDGLVSNYTSNGWINNTSILFNTVPSHNIYVNKVLLEYAEPLTDNNGWGYAFGDLNTLANVDGLYIVGADKVYNALANPSEALAMGCYADKDAFNADVSAWDGNGFWTVVDGYPVPNGLVNYEPPREPETVELTGSLYMEANDGQSSFTVDLTSVKNKLSGLELIGASVDGVSFAAKSYNASTWKVTLDKATVEALLGEKTVALTFSENLQINAKIVLCTQIIDTVADLKDFPTAAAQTPAGYYALGADIHYAGTYENTNTVPFTGTFDGNGHTIFDLCTKTAANDWDGGLFGKFFGKEDGTAPATLKNISFMNAVVKGQGSFLACKGQGTLDNVYMHFSIDGLVSGYTTNGWINNTSILFNTVPSHNIYINKVLLEYAAPLTDNNGWGYAFGILNTLANADGLYVVGADHVYNSLANPSEALAMGCYADKASFDADVSSWDGNGFWTVVDGYPVPNALVGYDPSNPPEPTEPETTEPETTEPETTEPETTEPETTAPEQENTQLKLTDPVLVEKGAGSTFTVDFGEQAAAVAGTTLETAVADGTSFTTSAYADGILTLDMAALGTAVGEKTVQLTFSGTNKTVNVEVSVILCTQIIDTADELRAFPAAAKANPGGYYALGADIHFEGDYSNTNTDAFTGTFNGCGHVIYNMATKTAYDDWDGGFFGKLFQGTLKNIAFQNAIVRGQGAFLAFRTIAGTLENVYIHVSFDGLVSGMGWINDTCVLFNDGNGNYLYATNVIVEHAESLTASAGYAFYQNLSVSKFNGLYVVGADKISAATLSGSSTAYGCYGDKASFDADVSAWDGNGFWTVVDGYPIPNALVDDDPSEPTEPETTEPETTEPELEQIQLTLEGLHYVGTKDIGDIFTIEFGEQKAAVADTELKTATVGGAAFTGKLYEPQTGVLSLDKQTLGTLSGENTIKLTFEGESKTVSVEIPVYVCTMVINNVEELKAFPTVAAEVPAGHYVLGNSIDFAGNTYSNAGIVPFTGIFDGQGYSIKNLCTKVSSTDWAGGFFGKFFGREDGSALATLRNISFENATVKGQGSFLACKGQGTLENVYMQVNIDGLVSSYTTNGWVNNTSIFFNTVPSHRIYIENVILEYVQPLTGNNGWGYAFGSLNSLSTVDGLYIVGADKAYNSLMNSSAAVAMGCYADAAAFQAAGIDFTAWYETDFWAEGENGTPVPAK